MFDENFLNKWKNSTSSLEEKTITLVKYLFKDKTDKANNPYIEHLYYVRDQFKEEKLRLISLLHDSIEDTPLTLDNLKDLGYSKDIIDTILVLTKPRSITYEDYIDNIINSKNISALKIKLIDLEHNMNINRIPNPQEEDIKRIEKYTKAKEKIENYLKKEGIYNDRY